MQIAPLQTYQGPELDPVGHYLRAKDASQTGALRQEKMDMLREDRTKEQQKQEQMQGILSQMQSGEIDSEKAALSALAVDPKMANSILNMEATKQQGALREQQMQINAAEMAQQRIKQRQAQIAAETRAAKGAATALEGVEEPSQKEKIYNLYMESLEKQGMPIPDELKGGWSPENEENIREIADMGQMIIDMDPTAKTAEIKNFEYAQQNPEFSDFFEEQNQREISGTEALVNDLIAEGSAKNRKEALEIIKGGAGATGRLGAEIDLGREAEREKEGGKLEERLRLEPEIEKAKMDARGEISEREELERGAKSAYSLAARNAGNVVQDSGRALEILDKAGRGAAGWGATLSSIPDTDARTLKGHIDSVKSNIGIDKLLEIKATGAGLGQVPQSQLDMLASTLGNLDQAQKVGELRDNLARTQNIYADVLRLAREGASEFGIDVSDTDFIEDFTPNKLSFDEFGRAKSDGEHTAENPAQPTTQEEYDALPKGAYFMDDEGLKVK